MWPCHGSHPHALNACAKSASIAQRSRISASCLQVRFGAQTGAAPIFLGLVKLVLGLAFGSSLFALLQAFPMPLLGAMLIFAGNAFKGAMQLAAQWLLIESHIPCEQGGSFVHEP